MLLLLLLLEPLAKSASIAAVGGRGAQVFCATAAVRLRGAGAGATAGGVVALVFTSPRKLSSC